MNNLAKKLSVGALSLMLSLSSAKAQNHLSKKDSIILNNINQVYDINYNPIEFPQEKIRCNFLQDPSFYGGCVIGAASLFNINYARNHFALSEREQLIKTTTCVYLAGVVVSVGAYIVSKNIIKNRKKKLRF